MPELPEVETIIKGIRPHIVGQMVNDVFIRQRFLRWPIPEDLPVLIKAQRIEAVFRRGKYILIRMVRGTLLMHLGMSGSLRIVHGGSIPTKHDHVDILLSNNHCLRFRDPRRFGAILWTENEPCQHSLLNSLGLEPFDQRFNGDYLYQQSKGRRISVKSFIMDSHIVVGIGNIYANEALFMAAIQPKRKIGRIAKHRYQTLTESIRYVLRNAIAQGGTTLKDFVNEVGNPGYFKQSLQVYGRNGEKCGRCQTVIREQRLNQRSTFYCPNCQR